MEKAMSHLKTLSLEESLRWMEEAREKNWKDQAAWRDDALKQGLKEGIQQGMEQGMEQGIQRGRAEGMSKRERELTVNMLKNGLDTALISRITGLSKDKIKKLKNTLL